MFIFPQKTIQISSTLTNLISCFVLWCFNFLSKTIFGILWPTYSMHCQIDYYDSTQIFCFEEKLFLYLSQLNRFSLTNRMDLEYLFSHLTNLSPYFCEPPCFFHYVFLEYTHSWQEDSQNGYHGYLQKKSIHHDIFLAQQSTSLKSLIVLFSKF